MTAMAACRFVRRKISSPACRSQVLPLIHRCIYFKEQNLPFVRQFSTVEEENKAASQDLKLSDNCIKQLKKIFPDGKDGFLRVAVEGGGCSGYKYAFDVDSDISEDDRIFEKDGAKVVIDEISLEYLKGSTVDYHEELIRSAFRILLNPNSETGCSCGASFSFKL